jgi:hypothetical protein
VEEVAQRIPMYAGLEGLHQLDHQRLLITHLHLVAGHFRFRFSRTRTSTCTGVP